MEICLGEVEGLKAEVVQLVAGVRLFDGRHGAKKEARQDIGLSKRLLINVISGIVFCRYVYVYMAHPTLPFNSSIAVAKTSRLVRAFLFFLFAWSL